MTDDETRNAVHTTIAVMAQLARCTRTAADDLLVQVLQSNETRLTSAVIDLLKNPTPPTAESISAALAAVGIKA